MSAYERLNNQVITQKAEIKRLTDIIIKQNHQIALQLHEIESLKNKLTERGNAMSRSEFEMNHFKNLYMDTRALLEAQESVNRDLRDRLRVPPHDVPPGPGGAQNASACYTVYGL